MAYSAWTYRGTITFSDTAKSQEVQALVYIDYVSGMKSDFGDLRFTDTSNNILPYYVDYYTASDKVRLWVRVPANQTSIYYYYGNSSATSESNGDNTFYFFDELYDLSEWSGDTSDWYISGSVAKCTTSGKKIYKSISGGIDGKSIYASIETKANTSLKFGIVYRASWGEVQFTRSYTSSYPRRWSDGTYQSTIPPQWSDSVDMVDRCDISTTKAATKHYFGNTSWTQVTGWNTHTAILPSAGMIGLYASASNTYQWVNWIRVQSTATLTGYSVAAAGYNQDEVTTNATITITGSTRLYEHLKPPAGTIAITPDLMPHQAELVISGNAITNETISTSANISISGSLTKAQNCILASAELYLSGNVLESTSGVDLGNYPYTGVTIKKSIADAMWQMSVDFEGSYVPPAQRQIAFDATDVYGIENRLFRGIIPDHDYSVACADNQTTITAYDNSYYLTRQKVPYDETTIKLCTEYPTWGSWITHLLDGTDITAYRIADGPTTSAEFTFSATTTKQKVITSIADYLGYLFYVRWSDNEAIAYFIDPANIDSTTDGLDLPEPLTITIDNGTLVGLPSVKSVSEKTYNRIIVRGRDSSDNVYLTSVAETSELTAGLVLATEYYEESLNYNTQAICDARSAFLLNGLSTQMFTVRATFIKRHDLRLWQKIRFTGSGFPTQLVNMGWLRIVTIQYDVREANEVVTIEATMDNDISLISELADVFDSNSTSETVSIVDTTISELSEICAGTITAIDGTTATVLLENGNTIQARLLS